MDGSGAQAKLDRIWMYWKIFQNWGEDGVGIETLVVWEFLKCEEVIPLSVKAINWIHIDRAFSMLEWKSEVKKDCSDLGLEIHRVMASDPVGYD